MKILVSGSDSNALVFALEMKRQGHDVEVLEGAVFGGVSALVPGCPLAPAVASHLEMGLSLQIVGRHGVAADGRQVDLKLREISGDVTESDKAKWRDFVGLMNKASELWRGLFSVSSDFDFAARWREFGRREALEVLRLPWQSLSDLLDFWFESDLLKATLASCALKGSRQGPFASGTAFLLVQRWAAGEVFGRARTDLAALKSLAETEGVVFSQEGVEAYELVLGKAKRLKTTGGRELEADAFVSTNDQARVFTHHIGLSMVDPEDLAIARSWHKQSTTTVAKLAPVESWNGAWVNYCEDIESLEKAYDPTKYGQDSELPFAEFDTASGFLYLQHIAGDGAAESAKSFCESRELGDISELLTPSQIEERFGASGGHLFGGEKTLWQSYALRQQLKNPIPKLHFCGASCGSGDYGGLSGLLCARELQLSVQV